MVIINTIKDFERQNREALYALLHVDELRNDYKLARASISCLPPSMSDGQPKGTKASNPTQSKALRLEGTEINKKWVTAVEQCESLLDEKQRMFLEYRRKAEKNMQRSNSIGRKGWVDYTQCKLLEWELHKDYTTAAVTPKRTLMDWQRKMVNMTVRIALSLGCFDEMEELA